MDYLFAFVILVVVIYRGLGWRDKLKALRIERDELEARCIHLTSENRILRAAHAQPSQADYSAFRQQQNPYNWQYSQNPFAYQNARTTQSQFNYGFTPPPQQPPAQSEWRREFGFNAGQPVTREAINTAFRSKALKAHPDKGGNTEDMARLNKLKQQAFSEVPA